MPARSITVDETEWWDRIAAAVDMLVRLPQARRGAVRSGGKAVQVIGDPDWPREPSPNAAGAVTAYVFRSVRDAEILRRLTQLPDETTLDNLMEPLAVYCIEMNSFVSVNDPLTPLEEHLARLQKGS